MSILAKFSVSSTGLALSAALMGCSPLGALNVMLGSDQGVVAVEDFAYGPEPRHRLDIYQPAEPGVTRRPAVLFFYGGSWRNGNRKHYRFVGQALADRGVVAVIPDYRLYPQVLFPEFVRDAAKAVRWVFEHADDLGVDPDRVSIAGHSAGAHLATTLALDPRYLAAEGMHPKYVTAVIGIAGPYAFDPVAYRSTRPIFEQIDDIDDARPAALATANRGGLATDKLPAFTLLHGATDTTVLPKNSEALATALRKRRANVRLSLYKNVGHYKILLAFFPAFNEWAPVLDDVVHAVNERNSPLRHRSLNSGG